MKRVAAYGFTFIVSLLIALPALAEKRVALVIGNAKYEHAARLDNPLRDAKKIADLLTKRGFEVVHRENLTLSAMRKVLKRFKRVARGSDIALLYFSGHGMEMQGDNYLIPIDAELARDDEVEDEAITLEKAQKSLRGARKLRLVILDACRNNPFAAKMTRSAGLTRSVSKGFAPVRVEGNILVAFAAKAGTVAYDGEGQNSPFAGAMLKHLFRPGLDVRRAFGYVRDDVRRETRGKQDPFLYGSLGGDIVPLAPGVQAKPSPASPFDNRASELAYWNAISSSKDPYKYEIFLRQFPNGTFAALAQRRKKELMEQRSKEKKVAVDTLPKPKPVQRNLTSGSVFDDCNGAGGCPSMVVVPKGWLMMGSMNGNKDEKPVHRVTFDRSFAVGRFEVTWDEWEACVDDGGCDNGPVKKAGGDNGWGKGKRPAIEISWHDAKNYLRWLSKKTSKKYRLLSEAEWEYVARTRITAKYSWGSGIGQNKANCGDCGSRWDGKKTAPVGSFKANDFKVHDMHGNVWEWVEDCYQDSYKGAPTDGSAKTIGSCTLRVHRGGSWDSIPRDLRSARRGKAGPDDRYVNYGFRVARSLP